MGAPVSQVQAPQTSQPIAKGGAQPPQPIQDKMMRSPVEELNQLATTQDMAPQGQMDGIARPMGKGGRITYPGQGGQPQIGQPNRYSNTVGPWDNATIGTKSSGKGKGV